MPAGKQTPPLTPAASRAWATAAAVKPLTVRVQATLLETGDSVVFGSRRLPANAVEGARSNAAKVSESSMRERRGVGERRLKRARTADRRRDDAPKGAGWFTATSVWGAGDRLPFTRGRVPQALTGTGRPSPPRTPAVPTCLARTDPAPPVWGNRLQAWP